MSRYDTRHWPLAFDPVARFPENTRGRDFVLGDTHGAFDLVGQALHRVRFDPGVDRLFSVGDLIDRGRESWRAAQFLALPGVHAVRGNHEEDLLELYAHGEPPEAVFHQLRRTNHNGMAWLGEVSKAKRDAVVDAIRGLPYVIEIQTPRGLVGVLHADVPRLTSWDEFVSQVRAADSRTIKVALRGRARVVRNRHEGVSGVGRVFVGHSIHWGGPAAYGNVIVLDTGATFADLRLHPGGMLTLMEITASREDLGPAAVGKLHTILTRQAAALPFAACHPA